VPLKPRSEQVGRAAHHARGRVATTEGRVTDGQGRLVAHGISTCMVFRAA
jgi:acyl-coenzyme A thioesterase PaaI-like protein